MLSYWDFKATGYRNGLDKYAGFYKPRTCPSLMIQQTWKPLPVLGSSKKQDALQNQTYIYWVFSLRKRSLTWFTDLLHRLESPEAALYFALLSSSEATLANELDSMNEEWINEFAPPASHLVTWFSLLPDNGSTEQPLNGPCTSCCGTATN